MPRTPEIKWLNAAGMAWVSMATEGIERLRSVA
jgi:hypothetical protein